MPARVPWRKTLYLRVMLLCAVLLLCLLGSVIVIARYYLDEAAQEMEQQIALIADRVELSLELSPGRDFESLENELMDIHGGVDIHLRPHEGNMGPVTFTIERSPGGQITRVAQVPLRIGDSQILLTARATILPMAEVWRALTNRYMMALCAVFIVTLGLMIYFIAKTMRPLTQLSQSCAAISRGDLRSVNTHGASGEIRALEETFNGMVEALREKELVEAKLRQAQRLSALGNLAAGVAHDVRNPLNAIKLLSSHAASAVDEETNAPVVKSLQTIRDEVERLEGIVSSFLSLAKESELNPQLHRIDPLLEDCVRLLQRDAAERGVELTADLRAGGRKLTVDPKHWTRAILNVLVNALESCHHGGKVRLLSRLTDRACQIEIRDDGPGFSKETADRIFEPYFTTKRGGTGLGLSITRGIVEEHGAKIEVYSPEGQGCQVLITIPFDAQPA